MRIVEVPLRSRSYRIKIGPGLLDRIGRECAALQLGRSCVIITDANIAPHYAHRCRIALEKAGITAAVLEVPAGEASKSLRIVARCYDFLAARRLERSSFVVALGGGVVGDLAGFVAATYLRGLAFVQLPTTLLSQVDSSVGGKTGVNLKAGKNLVGAFHQPRLVLCDLDTLSTLPAREYRSGLAEVIKYGIICDARFFSRLERDMPRLLRRDARSLAPVVARCCQIKADVVGQDETEGGLRAILNFGHTIGHGLEATAGYGKYLHGEAISIGQVAAARLSESVLGLPLASTRRIENLLKAAGLPTTARLSPRQRSDLETAMKLDKKVKGGEIRFVLVEAIGRCKFGCAVPAAVLEPILNEL